MNDKCSYLINIIISIDCADYCTREQIILGHHQQFDKRQFDKRQFDKFLARHQLFDKF